LTANDATSRVQPAIRLHAERRRFGEDAVKGVLAACALVALAVTGRLPAWLPVLVVSRDLAQLAGAALLRSTHRAVPVAPTRIGKYATVALAATVVVALAGDYGAYPHGTVGPFVVAFALLAAECVALSFAQYSIFFVRAVRAPR